MKKKQTFISIDGQTPSQETILVGKQDGTKSVEGFSTKGSFLITPDKGGLVDKMEEQSTKGKKQRSK